VAPIKKIARDGLGSRLRQLRKRSGWTLNQVSAMSGLAISTLSKVENNQTSLTYDNLLKLAEGLGVNIAELFASEEVHTKAGRRAITRNGDEKTQITPNYDYHFHGTELLGMRMTPIFVRVKARQFEGFGDLLQHSGEEFIYVLEGAIEVHTEFYELVRLDAGESIYIDSTMGHGYISVGPGDASILGVCSSPIPELLKSATPKTVTDEVASAG
jgi:transcriptional regulator with XRE-family HTH domain